MNLDKTWVLVYQRLGYTAQLPPAPVALKRRSPLWITTLLHLAAKFLL